MVKVSVTTRLSNDVATFALASLLPAGCLLVGLSVFARESTLEEWTALTVGISIGAVGALVVLWGWRLAGPAELALANPAERRDMYALSIGERGATTLVMAVVLVVAMALSIDGQSLVLGLAGAGSALLGGLSGFWYCVGTRQPLMCLVHESLPRAAGHVVGALVVGLGGELWLFPVSSLVGSLVGVAGLARAVHVGWSQVSVLRVPDLLASLRARFIPALSDVATSGYTAGAVAIVAVAGTVETTAFFSAGDRLLRAGLLSVASVGAGLQGWVLSSREDSAYRRILVSALVHLVVGTVGALVIALQGSRISQLLFGAELTVTDAAMRWFGVAFLMISISTSLGRHGLMRLGRPGAVLACSAVGLLVGGFGLVLGASQAGVEGAAAGLAIGEASVAALMSASLLRGPIPRALGRSVDPE